MPFIEFLAMFWERLWAFFDVAILSHFKSIDFFDIVDILLVGLLFFFLYRFAKRRRSLKLVCGVVVLFLILIFAEAINLRATKLIFGDLRQIGLIAILIIFQPEIRAALEKVGGNTFMRLQNINHNDKRYQGAEYVAEAVSAAANKLASMNYGALIVIQRGDALDGCVTQGTHINAVLSPDLITTVFYKGSALHDGAMVIKNDKIYSAGCILRMTSRDDIDSELGTRHRAAIGTSEVCDAVVVVVSEETGNISVSVGGTLERNFTSTSLRMRLCELLRPIKKEEKPKFSIPVKMFDKKKEELQEDAEGEEAEASEKEE